MTNYLVEFEDVIGSQRYQMSGCLFIVIKCILKYRSALNKKLTRTRILIIFRYGDIVYAKRRWVVLGCRWKRRAT